MANYLNDRLGDINHLKTPVFPDERDSVYQLYNIRFNDPEIQPLLAAYLDDRGIPTRVTYDPAHLTEYYRMEWDYQHGDLPVTEDVSEKILTLPFHLDLDESDLNRVGSVVREFFEKEY
jgi:perosamine synthetase